MSTTLSTSTSNTLAQAPVADLLTRLFAEAAASDATMRQMFGALTPAERTARMADAKGDYRQFFHRAKDIHLAVSPATGKLLYLLARATQARSIIEFGTSFGVSTVHLAAALRDNGGGRLIGTELGPNKSERTRATLAEAGLADLIEIRDGDALETLTRDLPDTIDFVLLDGHKPLYPRILDLLESRLRAGACIVADNADASPDYLARVRALGGGYHSLPFASDVEVSVKL